ncbi:hypothetical protein [Thauera humireducens]|uniref:hypothetical protein n=1 Tax=Thauera humireducens TaxID=1134435 RepID=UPI00311E0A76
MGLWLRGEWARLSGPALSGGDIVRGLELLGWFHLAAVAHRAVEPRGAPAAPSASCAGCRC